MIPDRTRPEFSRHSQSSGRGNEGNRAESVSMRSKIRTIVNSFHKELRAFKRMLHRPLAASWAKRDYWLRVLGLAALGLCATHLLESHNVLLHWRYLLYQAQTKHLPTAHPAGFDTVFVVIDDDAFWKGD